MNKSESKYFNTALRMDEALMKLLETKDFEYITIKEICAKAGVNRSTFYLHYENTRDLLNESINLMQERFYACFKGDKSSFRYKIENCSANDLYLITPEYLEPYLKYVSDHRSIYGAAMRNPSNFNSEEIYKMLFNEVFDPILDKYSVLPEERVYIMAFYLKGIAAMVSEWLEEDCKMPIDRLTEIIIKLIPKSKSETDTN